LKVSNCTDIADLESAMDDLRKLDADKDLKNFIQVHLVSLVRGQKTSANVKSKRSGSNGA
jgi:hypothetical protein